MKDLESIKEKYGPTLLSVIMHTIFLLLLFGVFSTARQDSDIPRYIAVQIGSPYRTAQSFMPFVEMSPEIAQKITEQREFQKQIAEQIQQAEELADQGILPNIPITPQEKQIAQEQKQAKAQQQRKAQAKPQDKRDEGKGVKNGNAENGQDSATYLEWLQLTVQETSQIPIQAREQGISGNAVLRLSIDRDGYVHDYRLVRETGSKLLDAAALRVARRLKVEPFPPMPTDFEQGKQVVTYDFPISFTP